MSKKAEYAKSRSVLYKQISKTYCLLFWLSKPFKAYLGKDAVYNFINSMIEKSKYCNDVL